MDYAIHGIVYGYEGIRSELVRKSLHFLIAIVPSIASVSPMLAASLLGCGMFVYAFAELARQSGREIFLISGITRIAARPRDSGKFVLGPLTLATGALLALAFYPDPAASIAIYALAFGDGAASLAGRLFGSLKIPFTGGKTLEGSAACFLAVLSVAYGLTWNFEGSLVIAGVATLVELFPLKDWDNILLPMAAGAVAALVS